LVSTHNARTTAGRFREDTHDVDEAFDLLVQPLQHVGALEVLVLARQAVESERLARCFPRPRRLSRKYLFCHVPIQAANSARASARSSRARSLRSARKQRWQAASGSTLRIEAFTLA
jgi:hypothetical protein